MRTSLLSRSVGKTCIAAMAAAGLFPLLVRGENSAQGSDANANPWGVSSSAHSTPKYPEWIPKMTDVGVMWARMFPGWGGIEPKPGEWNWEEGDKMVQTAADQHFHLSALLAYSAPWAIPPGATGAPFPMDHLDQWAEYAGKTVAHYKDHIHYWEIWNEPNGSFKGHYGPKKWDTTADYATLMARAYDAAKKSDPSAQIGMTCASFDVPYFEQVILAEKAMRKPDRFDYFCIHPYETIGGLSEADGEVSYLWMSRMLRDMLTVQSPAKANAEIWITEIGRRIGNQKESKEKDSVNEAVAAVTLVKAYVMAIAQGIKRICWFEAEDPVGEPPGYGLLDIEGKPRVSYDAMKAMTTWLGETPKYQGWLALGDGGKGYGFAFTGPSGDVLVAWMPAGGRDRTLTLTNPGVLVDPLKGTTSKIGAGKAIDLSDKPVFIIGMTEAQMTQAKANVAKPFPWGGNFANATVVSVTLGKENDNQGIIQVERKWTTPYTFPDGSSGALVSPPGKHDAQNIKFITHPSFASVTTHDYYVRVTARHLAFDVVPIAKPGEPSQASLPRFCGMNLVYELADTRGGWPVNTGEWRNLPNDNRGWQTVTWHLTDASFSKMWGYDFALSIGKSSSFVIGKVEVSTQPFAN